MIFFNTIEGYRIDLCECSKQSYYSTKAMPNVYKMVHIFIKEHAKNADYVQCMLHSLNLVLNNIAKHISKVPQFYDNLEIIYNFFWVITLSTGC